MTQVQQAMNQRKNRRQLGKQTREVSEKTKKAVLKAALTVFAQEGFFNAKLRNIAALAGTTHSLIRHHFGSKDDLWKAVVDYGLQLHDNSRTSPHLDYLIESQKRLHAVIEPVFKNAQACGYFKGFDHDSFSVYVRALVETPIATRDLTNHLLKDDIRSEKGIALHTERVLRFLFHKET